MREYFTEETLLKVYRALRKSVDEDKAMDIITDLQNEGILFRERAPEQRPDAFGPIHRGAASV